MASRRPTNHTPRAAHAPGASGLAGVGGVAGAASYGAANEGGGAFADGPQLRQRHKVVLVLDLVESVRLMAEDESGVVARWHSFTRKAQQMIPRHQGRVVKSLGDGMLCEFDHARHAVQAATALHQMIKPANQGRAESARLYLRIGLNATHLYLDDVDVYGTGVNLAARLATLAGPGETIAGAGVRDQLTDGLDADLEDMGDCYLKHVPDPVRAYRVGPPGPRPVLQAVTQFVAELLPAVAVIPFAARGPQPDAFAIGELIADGVIGQLSQSHAVRVIARLSCSAFQQRNMPAGDIAAHLKASFVLMGSYVVHEQKVRLHAELVDTRNDAVIWVHEATGALADLAFAEGELIPAIASGVVHSILNAEVHAALLAPLPNLNSGTLMISAISLMHRLTPADFYRAGDMLEHLTARHPRHVVPKAWLARWHNLAVAQGWSRDAVADRQKSFGLVNQALDLDPRNAFALTIHALLQGYGEKQFETAQASYEDALAANPNEPLAWIGLSTLKTWQGAGHEAVTMAEKALALSPLDPMRYYFDSLAASAHESAGNYAQAVTLAERSIRLNRNFFSSHLALFFAQAMQGKSEEARTCARKAMHLRPDFTVSRYRNTSPHYRSANGPRYAELLKQFGFPE